MSPQPAANTQSSAQRQIARAADLERKRAEIMKQVEANRKYLRLMDENDELTDQESEWLEVFYPLKEKGETRSKTEVEATRKLREQAREG